jgi:hypothetical protein
MARICLGPKPKPLFLFGGDAIRDLASNKSSSLKTLNPILGAACG